jgi:hypothetical protein
VIVVCGNELKDHLKQMHVLERLGIAGLALGDADLWVFGTAPRR